MNKEQERVADDDGIQVDRFASVVAHDLRNPLNIAEGQVELAQRECDSEHLDEVARAHNRMRKLISDLLTFAREGGGVHEREVIDLETVIGTCWRNVATSEASLTVDADRRIHADRGRLKQLFENLMRNAIEHGPDDVRVAVGELPGGLYVEDDGPGIPADVRTNVFDVDCSTDGEIGLGLSIVDRVAAAHGWAVGATDGNAGGARFEITGCDFVDE